MSEAPVLVLGFGNPGRCDDGLGPELVTRLESLGLKDVTVEWDYQLQVEDCELVSKHQVVLFVDASRVADEPFSISRVEPRGDVAFSTHSMAPEAILALAKELFGASPPAFMLGIRAYELDELRESLSSKASDNLKQAETFVVSLLQRHGSDPLSLEAELLDRVA